MKEVSFACGCYYKRDGRTIFISAHGEAHPNIFHVLAQLPFTEQVIGRLYLAVNQSVFQLIDTLSYVLSAIHFAHEYKGILDDNEYKGILARNEKPH